MAAVPEAVDDRSAGPAATPLICRANVREALASREKSLAPAGGVVTCTFLEVISVRSTDDRASGPAVTVTVTFSIWPTGRPVGGTAAEIRTETDGANVMVHVP